MQIPQNGKDLLQFRKNLGLTQKQLADLLEVDDSRISRWERNGTPLSKGDQLILFEKYNSQNKNSEQVSVTKASESEPDYQPTAHLIPFYDIDVTAGLETLFNDGPLVPSYYFDIPAFRGCHALPMRGDSMMDTYNPGDILFLQEITYWPRWMIWNRVCVVVTREERMVKLVDKSEKEGYWRLISHNTAHRAFDIPVDEILKVFVVRGAVRHDSYVVQSRVILREEEFLQSLVGKS